MVAKGLSSALLGTVNTTALARPTSTSSSSTRNAAATGTVTPTVPVAVRANADSAVSIPRTSVLLPIPSWTAQPPRRPEVGTRGTDSAKPARIVTTDILAATTAAVDRPACRVCSDLWNKLCVVVFIGGFLCE